MFLHSQIFWNQIDSNNANKSIRNKAVYDLYFSLKIILHLHGCTLRVEWVMWGQEGKIWMQMPHGMKSLYDDNRHHHTGSENWKQYSQYKCR